MTKMEKAAQRIIRECIGLGKNESLLILADEPMQEKAELLHRVATKISKNVSLLYPGKASIAAGLDFAPLALFMQSVSALIAITTCSISHTEARRKACQKGVRCLSMPNILDPSFARIADFDIKKVARLSMKLRDILTIAKEARIQSANGTDLRIPIAGNNGSADLGMVLEPGEFSNLPAGEASIMPEDGKAEGIWIVDSGMGRNPQDKESLVLTIRDGRAARITGGRIAQSLSRRLSHYGADARIVAELGVGTNSFAKLCGSPLEDEKVLGTVHLALGNNVSFGGTNQIPIHLDGVIYNATLTLDGKEILNNGRWVLQ